MPLEYSRCVIMSFILVRLYDAFLEGHHLRCLAKLNGPAERNGMAWLS
jgi:hypothetical protein